MRKKFLFLLIVATASISFSQVSNASEPCFSQLPDTEWKNGEPQEVINQLNFDLVGNIQVEKPQHIGLGAINPFYFFNGLSYTTTYSYQGKNCSIRVIKIVNQLLYEKPNEISLSEYLERGFALSKSSANYMELEFRTKSVLTVQEVLSNKQFEVGSSKQLLPGEEGNMFQLARNLTQKFISTNDSLYLRERLRNSGEDQIALPEGQWFLYFPSRCAHAKLIGQSDKIESSSISYLGMARGTILFKGSSPCIAELRIAGVKDKVSEVKYILKNEARKLKITCTKGKLTKTVTGTNPKCPTGYKQK